MAETPLGRYHVIEPKVIQSSIFEFVFENVTKTYQGRKYDKDDKETYDYLLNLGIRSVSQDKINELQRKIADDEEKLQTLEDTTEKQMWLAELDDFAKHYKVPNTIR